MKALVVAAALSFNASFAHAQVMCVDLFGPHYASKADQALALKYDIVGQEIISDGQYKYIINGDRDVKPRVTPNYENPIRMAQEYDTIVVGGGPSGLTSTLFLAEGKQKVLLLDPAKHMGGLAIGGERRGVEYGRGGAYLTANEGYLYKIFKHIGLGKMVKELEIHEHIDSYVWNGKLYEGLWESPQALAELPASFSVFKHMIIWADKVGQITMQPMERYAETGYLDSMSATEWVNRMPGELQRLAARDPQARKLLQRFLNDPNVDKNDPMKDVIGLLELYGRSALGDHPDKISAAAFANFYIAEVDKRYTGTTGAGASSKAILKKLKKHPKNAHLQNDSQVVRIENTREGVNVYYLKDGQTHMVKAKKAIFSAPLKVAADVIKDFETTSPAQYRKFKKIGYRSYLVVNVHLKNKTHPWKHSYDLWVRDDANYNQNMITDIIDGRWVDAQHDATVREDGKGVISVYFPLSEAMMEKGLQNDTVVQLANSGVNQMIDFLKKADPNMETPQVELVEINRWASSIHVVTPGYFKTSEQLGKPVGNIHFANNNLGLPSVEEALFRGATAAVEILGFEPNWLAEVP